MVYVNKKIYTNQAYKAIEGSWKSFNHGYYQGKEKFITCDGYEFWWEYSNFSNIPDVIDYKEDGIRQDDVKNSIIFDVFWSNVKYEIEEIKEKLKDEYYEDEWDDLKEELEELEAEQEEYEDLIGRFDDKSTIEINNLGISANSISDFDYWEVKIDVVNGVATYSNYEETVVTDDLNWVEGFLLKCWEWFPNIEVLEYIVQHEDFFNIEIIKGECK